MPKIIQFEGKRFHEQCFDNFLTGERAKNKHAYDWRPNIQTLDEKDVETSDMCEECSGTLLAQDTAVDTLKNAPDDDEQNDKSDSVTDTPSPTHRRRR